MNTTPSHIKTNHRTYLNFLKKSCLTLTSTVIGFTLIGLGFKQFFFSAEIPFLAQFLFTILVGFFWKFEIQKTIKDKRVELKKIRKYVKIKKKNAQDLSEKIKLMRLEKQNFIRTKHLELRSRYQQDFFLLIHNLIEKKTGTVITRGIALPILSDIKEELRYTASHEFYRNILIATIKKEQKPATFPVTIEFIFPTEFLCLN